MTAVGYMQDRSLTVDAFLDFAERWHPTVEIVSRRADGSTEMSSYAAVHAGAKRLSARLLADGIAAGDRIGTIAMNNIRHLEAWYATMGIGAVCHTINPRLFREQIVYIVNHAGDRMLLVDAAFAALAIGLLPDCPTVERLVVLPDGSDFAASADALDYDRWIAAAGTDAPAWGGFDERQPCGLCYTSGTTSDPKGVLYSHRSNYLHALTSIQPDVLDLSATDVVLPIVPMFHANGWGIPFSAPAVGAKLVLPGARLDGSSLCALIREQGVTFAAGVPTVWQGVLQELDRTGGDLGPLQRILVGGSACPPQLIRTMEDRYGVEVRHAWGMTETSPIASVATPTRAVASADDETRHRQAIKQGRPVFGLDVMLEDDSGVAVAHDGQTPGHLLIRGATVVQRYYRHDRDATNAGGWFDTDDIATIDAHGYVHITDRAKDLIKSGGEWISSIEIETIVMGHPAVACAAVVAVPDERWGERPLLLVELKPATTAAPEEFRAFLDGKVARWWMPETVRIVDRLPLGATGKIDKKMIRRDLCDLAR